MGLPRQYNVSYFLLDLTRKLLLNVLFINKHMLVSLFPSFPPSIPTPEPRWEALLEVKSLCQAHK